MWQFAPVIDYDSDPNKQDTLTSYNGLTRFMCFCCDNPMCLSILLWTLFGIVMCQLLLHALKAIVTTEQLQMTHWLS